MKISYVKITVTVLVGYLSLLIDARPAVPLGRHRKYATIRQCKTFPGAVLGISADISVSGLQWASWLRNF